MPIFHDAHDSPPQRSPARHMTTNGARRAGHQNSYSTVSRLKSLGAHEDVGRERGVDMESSAATHASGTFDRADLIERLKRTKSPQWRQLQTDGRSDRQIPVPQPSSRDQPTAPSLIHVESGPSRDSTPDPLRDFTAAGLEIERPRSALHSGDFRAEAEEGNAGSRSSVTPFLATSPVAPWNRSFPAGAYTARNATPYSSDRLFDKDSRAVSRARATSQSSTGSFAFLPPTSPLVHQANTTDLDSSRPNSRQGSRSPESNNRRHTFSPASFQPPHSSSMARSISGTPAARHLRYGSSIPYQAHQPRRSLTINPEHVHSSPQTPLLTSRRPSFSSEASPLHHAPMVGSYEESILRGRMSTTPSRPLDFVAKIGVLGKEQCRPNLKCPPHVTVPFPAVFYSYNTGNGRISDNEPSPYVGLIDLENSLATVNETNENTNRKRRHAGPTLDQDNLDLRKPHTNQDAGDGSQMEARKREKRKRRSTSPKAPPGGSYRIPSQGQLQIVLKNPNNTAVKLYLVPYDVSDMEPGQKTFIRQRSYSAGPIIDMPMASRKNLGTDRPEAAISTSDDPNDRPVLRYLIHLHICCPSKGRYYLYKSIRVVFANRVPDGKEKLAQEIQQPEPKYSAYKPTRDALPQAGSSAVAQPSTDKAFRRRSAGWPLSRSQQAYDQLDGLPQRPPLPPPAVKFTGGGGTPSSSTSSAFNSPVPQMQPIPFSLTRLAAIESRPVSRDRMDVDTKSLFRTPVASPKSGLGSPIDQHGTFGKLNKGDVGYGGNAFSPLGSPTSPPSAGLLSQRLRGLEVQRNGEQDDWAESSRR